MSIMEGATAFPPPPPAADSALTAHLCVLASGSAGNCSVLLLRRGGVQRLCLIDLGLSPRRTTRLLRDMGFGLHHVDDVIVTHLDTDHFHPGWTRALPRHATLHLHERHADNGHGLELGGLFGLPAATFDGSLRLRDGTLVRSVMADHDEHGVATLRFCLPGGCLGFATDIGRVTADIVRHLAGVDVLAIESNYCPVMQENSGRPIFLKRRIMGGRGHLSNHEAAHAIGLIEPKSHVVLLHLSRQCNDPALVASIHQGAPYTFTITNQYTPTPWIPIGLPA